ncbi:hypothetical protein J8244_02705 [Corynebacterium tuberculostearicum]|uniref:hypothetical protein n=1 Tax=Corynebacterium tuberculostearicum TaxID=38304 RepID=UPI0026656D0B|nr:hypothetical protein [Corynebacterium tuberculostearicum]WKE51238.1 hypothetical protein J8244_02705 [Corynebacterium tuberculostearicum]
MTATPPSPAPAPRTQRPPRKQQRPESVTYMLWLWLGALCGEAVHQVLNVVLTLLNHDVLMSQAKEMAKSAPAGVDEAQLSDAFLRTAAYGSVALSAAISLAIIVLLAFLLRSLANRSKRAGTSRRVWFAFSLYFGFRILLTFMVTPAGADVPDWLFAADGMVQILVGVAAVLGLIFSVRAETLDYTGELEQMRELEKELEQAQREKNRAEEERKRSKGDQRGKHDGGKRERPDRTNRADRADRADREDKR